MTEKKTKEAAEDAAETLTRTDSGNISRFLVEETDARIKEMAREKAAKKAPIAPKS